MSLEYHEVAYRFYDLLVDKGPWNVDFKLPCVFPWDEFMSLNPRALALAVEFRRKHRYELSERQCSAAVMALRSYPAGPKIVAAMEGQ